ncbi:MAG: GNAT family N-acetyltransferase [Thermomicrobiales bacterium]|nr:GNAT family N-acetyltransferase [Thermomicrobiales bacterium]
MVLWRTEPAASDWEWAPELDIRVARTRTAADHDAALEIRRRVFAQEQHVTDLRVSDPDDTRSIIALARVMTDHGLEPVGTGRLTLSPLTGGPALVAWVATLAEWRGHGVGHEVMAFLLHEAEKAGAHQVVLAAQAHAESFYRRLGFTAAGPLYDVRGIPHLRMTWQKRRR